MKRVKMKRNREVGAETYKGEVMYTLPDDVADSFLHDGHAELIENIPDKKQEKQAAAEKKPDKESAAETKARPAKQRDKRKKK